MGASAQWTKARRVLLTTRAKDTHGKVGRLYEHLMASVLGCEIAPRSGNSDYGDIFSNDLGIRVEVKARGDKDSHELRVTQMKEYETEAPFPISDSLYALVTYQSTRYMRPGDPRPWNFSEKTKSVSLLRSIRSTAELNELLAQNVQTVYLLDLRVMRALRRHFGSKKAHIPVRGLEGERAVRVNRSTLNELFGDDVSLASTLETLRLNASGWAKGVYPMHVGFSIDRQVLSSKFTLVTLLRRRLHADIARAINGKTLTLE